MLLPERRILPTTVDVRPGLPDRPTMSEFCVRDLTGTIKMGGSIDLPEKSEETVIFHPSSL